ncbi:MAG: hypothetical protein CM15mP129_08640 [Chloroflexota bacterium]|nr:MAG: hypothetical protein CM15mP129_08640 [Chloroflexota bacterium]
MQNIFVKILQREVIGDIQTEQAIFGIFCTRCKADEVTGKWIQHSDGLGWFNTDIRPQANSIIYSYFSTKTGKYSWINTSCSENLSSILYQPNNSVEGRWLGPKPEEEKEQALK